MNEANYLKDSEKFWETHRQAKEKRNKKLASLSFSEKTDITERLQMDYEILQNAKEQFGLGKVANSETDISVEHIFTQADFDNALNKVFPFTQELQAGQESPKT